MALRQIRTFEDEILRKKCKPITEIDERIHQILDDMAETMYSTPNGGGLAACQVGILRSLVVIDMGQGLLKLVNPQIVEKHGQQITIEGCLSFPGVWGKVERPLQVVIQALDEKGKEIVIRAEGELAKCLCHEIDHLNGIVFTDKVIEYVDMD
ncbi:peptide deformylase [Aminipila sp.]|uniref:peptide deformylase n=1 Tax=Aminipila sp. TaxID=2060095 RepID=UPI001DEFBE68|nr:peptide deformylase [Aminipila sp.]MBE6034749.1 peptide deformylase [Clostridiales bacterium]